MQIIEA